MTTHIASTIPGRTRFKVPPKRRNPEEMARLASGLQAHPDVHDVQYNAQTGSILVHHHHHPDTVGDVCDTLRDLGCVFADVTGTKELITIKSQSGTDLDFDSAISDLNRRFLELTNGLVDLRFVLPIGIGTLAVLQLITFGWQFEVVPWYVLAYFAFDSFIKLNFSQNGDVQSELVTTSI